MEKIDPLDTVLASPTKHLSPILACSDNNILKNKDLVLDNISSPTLKIFGTGSLDHILTTDTGYSYLRSKTPNNGEPQETKPKPDDTAGSSRKAPEKKDLEFAYPNSEILDSVLDGVPPPAIHKKSSHTSLTWKTDNASPKPSRCREREKETCAIYKRNYYDLRRHMRRDHGDRSGVKGLYAAFPAKYTEDLSYKSTGT